MVRIRLEPPQTHQSEMLGEFFFCLFLKSFFAALLGAAFLIFATVHVPS